MMTDAARIEKIFEKYKFTAPIPAPMRGVLAESRKKVLKATLKELKKYSAWYALVLLVLLKGRNIGIRFSFTAAKAVALLGSIVASGMIISGAYVAVKYYQVYFSDKMIENKSETIESGNNAAGQSGFAVEEKLQSSTPEKEQTNSPAYEIYLYNGKKYNGVILSRGKSYVINTPSGKITIPLKQIKMIKRAGN